MPDRLLDLSIAVARIEARLKAADDNGEDRQELLRHVVREAVLEALEPLKERLDLVEDDVKAAKLASQVAGRLAAGAFAVFGPILAWLVPRLVTLVPVFLLLGCPVLPTVKDAARTRAEALCFDAPTSRHKVLSEAEAEACERLLNSR